MGDHGRDDALDYHSGGRPGKTEVVPTKPTATQRDLALAYTIKPIRSSGFADDRWLLG